MRTSHGFDKNVNKLCYYCWKDDFWGSKAEEGAFEKVLGCSAVFSLMKLYLHMVGRTLEKKGEWREI